MKEEAVLFGDTRSLVGIITNPPEGERGNNLPAILLLNAGILHRVGPNRLHVKMARGLAMMGFVVLRFDLSGIGDSRVRDDTLPIEKSVISDTQKAMDYLSATMGIERFVLMGMCSGALISLKLAWCDPRVVGAVPINTPGHIYAPSDESNRTLARHYWRVALSSSFRSKNFLKVVMGRFDYRRVMTVMGFCLMSLLTPKRKISSRPHDVAGALRSLTERGVNLLFIHSEGDEGLDYLELYLADKVRDLCASGKVRIEIIRGSNHIFTLLRNQEDLLTVVQDWVGAMVPHRSYP